jgi:hypothetical protein
MLTKNENLDFSNLNGGNVQEAFDQHLDRLIKNCLDMNAGMKSRKLIVMIEVTPNERRDEVSIKTAVYSKLLNTKSFLTAATMGVDDQGRGVMREFQTRQKPLLAPTSIRKEAQHD